MAQGQTSIAQNTIASLMTEMEKLTTPEMATKVDAPACLISRVTYDPAKYIYKPDMVHIGPLNPNRSDWMEKEKKQLLRGLLDRHGSKHQEELLRYLTAMKDLEEPARQCYDRKFSPITEEPFRCMLLVDGYYLYSRFVVATTTPDVSVFRDVVFLLENQIPFFVLEKIHKLIAPGADVDDSAFFVVDNVARHVETVVHRHGYVSKKIMLDRRQRPCHLLHLLYMYFRPTALGTAKEAQPQLTVHINGSTSSPEDMPIAMPPARWRTATYYYAAGVSLVKRELDDDKARSILDVELKGGTLHVPCLTVDSNTWGILCNMVALEQKSPWLGSHVTAYCLFMSQMANTEKDVALLVSKGIIVHFLPSDNDVATGLSKLCDGVHLDVNNPNLSYLTPKQEALEELCRDGWRKSKAWLRHNKCNNSFMKIAVVAAIIVFICTVEQSVFAILSYAKEKN